MGAFVSKSFFKFSVSCYCGLSFVGIPESISHFVSRCCFRPFFNPRKPISLSNFGGIPLSRLISFQASLFLYTLYQTLTLLIYMYTNNISDNYCFSEFDIAAYVVYVGNVYTDVEQKKQWVFVTDGSTQRSRSGEISNSLLAISFSTPSMDDLPTPHISHSLVGSVVLVKLKIFSLRDRER